MFERSDITIMVRAIAAKPLDVLMAKPGLSVAQLAELVPAPARSRCGVRRVSVGGALAPVPWGAVLLAAEQLQAGSFANSNALDSPHV